METALFTDDRPSKYYFSLLLQSLRVYWIRDKNIEFLAIVIRGSFQGSRTFLVFFQLLRKVGHRSHSLGNM